ncbi:filamentous hemagglutinin N-terminal domain-containing protein [Citrobacter sp. EC_71]|uniref:two-partner secretion domain-containing protein n=1 Tax=Citrobacter sp. EC_71 TaxID=2584093 RepID=UPI001C70698B|nr:hemagglutinin repeat-containing protein [Citrobacter sp. EC_71]MBW9352992.1 filamentous hemagglutinin N-terminal domain-containing protein [Citrobacter sp. EC_71]
MKNKNASKQKITAKTLHKHLRPIYLSLAGILSLNAEAATTPDSRQVNGPTMGQTANGTPMVNITNPNAKGISLNKFDQFNVDQQGMVFNNSKQDGVTKIGGYAIKNAQLQQEASAIISEVTGAQASYINGTMEVFGKKADIIVANENGISVNGATTINANSLTLSTGKVQMKDDGDYMLAVDKGNIAITGQGVSTDGLSYFDVVSRSAQLQGEISGTADIKILAGTNDYDLEKRSYTARSTGDNNTPTVAIDGSTLGSMYGGRIQLISTESGAGVRHAGGIIASNDIEINANGDLSLTTLHSDKAIMLAGNNVTLNKDSSGKGGTEAQGNIIINALAGATVSNDLLSHSGTIRIDASSLVQNAAALITESTSKTSVPSIQINVAGEYTLTGSLKALDANGNTISGGVVTLKNGDFVVLVNGKETAFSSIVSDAEVVSHSGDIAVTAKSMSNNSGVIMAKKGTLQINLTDVFENSGSINASGDITLTSGSMKNNGILYTSGNQTLTVSTLENNGRLFADKQLVMRASALNNKGNIGTSSGDINIAVAGNLNNSGNISGDDASLLLAIDGNVDNNGNIVSNKKDVTLSVKGKSVKNSGKIEGRNIGIIQSDSNAELTNTGSMNAKTQLQIKTAKLSNNGGQLSSAGEIALAVSKQVNNSAAGEIIAEGALNIQTEAGGTLQNDGGGWIQGASVTVDGLTSLTNSGDAAILATGDLTLRNLETLSNDSATIQAGNINLADIGTLSNTAGGTLYASDNLSLSNIDILNNNSALIMSDGHLALDNIGTLTNSSGASLYSEGATQISNITTLNNLGGSAIQSNTLLDIKQVETLTNAEESLLSSAGDIQLDNITTFNNSAYVISEGKVSLSNGNLFKNEGIVQAGTDLIISNLRSLINQGNDHLLIALGNLTLQDVDSLLNTDHAVITAGMNTVLNAIGIVANTAAGVIQAQEGKVEINTDTLNNSGTMPSANGGQDVSTIVAGGDININAATINNTQQAVIVSSDANLTINASDMLNNSDSSVLVGNNKTTITAKNTNNTNGALIGGNDIAIISDTLNNNSSGTISAESALTLALTHLDNNSGVLESALTLALDVVDSIYLDDYNNDIRAGKSLNISTQGEFTNNANIEAIGDLSIDANKTFTNNESIITAGNLNINAGDIINNENKLLWSMGDMSLEARNGKFTNNMLGNVLSMGDISIIAQEIWNYAGIIRAEKDINIDAKTIKNESTYTGGDVTQTQTQDASGEYHTIDHVTTKIDIETTFHIPVLVSDITLDKLAEISAGGNININQRDIYEDHDVTNEGGLIQAGNDITITGNIYNSPKYTSESIYDYLNITLATPITIDYSWGVIKGKHGTEWEFNSLYQYFDFIFGNGSAASKSGSDSPQKERSYYALVDASNNSTQLKSIMNKVFGETWSTQSFDTLRDTWATISGNNDATLKDDMIYFVPLEKGEITAGHNFTQNGGTINNGIANAGVINQGAEVTNVDVGEYNVDTVIAGYDIHVNTQNVEELKMGISPLPTIKDLISIPGMFELSTDFKKASEAEKNGTEYSGPSNNIVPIFETRPDMLDQSKFTGSEYFFEQVGYNPTTPVNVIGDNYFTSELIRREVSSAVGSFFSVRDGLEGDALVQDLMNNAGVAATDSELGLVVGQPLTDEQKANLDQDIVWYVSQSVNGVEVMVPVVYLCPETLKQIETGEVTSGSAAISAGNNVDVDADAINNMNGSIQSGGDMTLVSQGDINNVSNGMDSGISSGGDITMTTTEGDINSSGAAIKADGDIAMSAENGDITMTASVGRNEDGSQQIHANDDGVTAGGSVAMKAKSITSNASDITAGSDITLQATDGDVTFNDLHQVESSRTIDSDITGAGSYKTVDTKSATGTAIGSNVSAGGNMSIEASNDVVMEGGTYTAETGSIKADNNVTIKTSEDVSVEEKSTTSRQFIAEASASGGGQTVEAGYGVNDGTSTSTTSGDYTSGGSQGESESSGGRPGRAAMGDSANFRIGMETTTDTTTTQTKTNTNAAINFTDSGSIESGKTADIGGADLSAGNDLSISAEEVTSTKYLNETKTSESHKESFMGISGEAHSTIADSIDKFGNLAEKAQDGQDINGGTTTAEVLGDVSNVLFNDLAGGSVSIGVKTTTNSATSSSSSENISNINAGNVKINSKNDTTLNGVDIKADDVAINAGGNVDINAAQATSSYSTESTTHQAGLTLDAGVDTNSASAGVSFGYNGSKDNGSGNSTSYTNSSIEGANVKINAGGDMTMSGANIAADKTDVNVGGDLIINSVQDTAHTEASNANWGASVGVGISTAGGVLPSVAANGGGGSESYDSATTAKQSSISTTGELNVKTGGDLNMEGSHLVSGDGTGAVDVAGNINVKDLEDHIEQDGTYGGAGLGFGVDGFIPTANLYVDTVDEIHYNETQKSTIAVDNTTSNAVNGNVNTDKENMSVVTRDEKEAGNNISFTIGDPGLKKKGNDAVESPATTRNKADTHSKKANDATVTDKTHSETASSEAVPAVKPSSVDALMPTPKATDSTTVKNSTPSETAHSEDVPAVKPPSADALTPTPKATDSTTVKDSTPSETAHSEDVPAVKPPSADALTPTPKATDSTTVKDSTPSETAHSEDVPAVKPSTASDIVPKPKAADSTKTADVTDATRTTDSKPAPAKKWAVPNTNYPVLSPGSATGKSGMNMPNNPAHRKWNGDMTNGITPSSNTSGQTPTLSPGSATGKSGMDMPKTPKHVTTDSDQTNGVMPSSNTSGQTPTLSPGSATGKSGMDMPNNPAHRQWNGDMTNGITPSSNTSGQTPTLSPGSATGKSGMDMPKTPEHKTLNGAMIQRGNWKQLLSDTPINIYATVTVEFKDSDFV